MTVPKDAGLEGYHDEPEPVRFAHDDWQASQREGDRMNETMTVARATGPSSAGLRGLLDDFLRTIGEPPLGQDSFARILKAIEDDRIRFKKIGNLMAIDV